jgi:hypothetical protein
MTRRDWLAFAPAAILTVSSGLRARAQEQQQERSEKPRTPDRDGGAAGPAAPTPKAAGPAPGATRPASPRITPEFPSHDPALVREVVGASHSRIDRVRELVEASPALAKATWDWGFGDWESPIEAASHVGRADIAELLLQHGARPNVFTFAMLGKLDAVRACLEALPDTRGLHGPHGITLLQHARNGGEPATAVVAYLESLGGADRPATSLAISDEQKKLYVGRYTFGDGPEDVLEVAVHRKGMLTIQRGQRAPRVLNRVEEHGFAPSGAEAVRVRFRIENGAAVAVVVHDPEPLVTAVRAG